MRIVFVDSSFYIALAHDRDADHASALRLGSELASEAARYITSVAVVLEVLAYFSRLGPRLRERAAMLAERLLTSPAVNVITLDESTLQAGLGLYRKRLDKRYSLADCLTMVICRERGITDILSTDRDFEAEGFTILLKL